VRDVARKNVRRVEIRIPTAKETQPCMGILNRIACGAFQ
jgi:hypothetical protein